MISILKEPSLAGLAVGSQEFFDRQKQLISERPLLNSCYDKWYELILGDARSVRENGILLELGSGGSCLKDLEKDFITSDVVPDVADHVIDARDLPFPDSSIQAIALTHVFHHIPQVEQFLEEAVRTLKPGGVITMIEVAHTPFARFFFSNFHPEPYNDKAQDWDFSQKDSMMDSNQALSWLVFVRDRDRFESLFPELSIETTSYTPWLAYLLSGGVTMKHLVPRFMNPLIHALEFLLTPFRPVFALHWHIRVRRKP
jgi:SAM-dependent methyltransferase